MERRAAGTGSSALVTLATLMGVAVGLYLARDLLIPLALAILLSFLLSPLVSRLERGGLPRVPAVIVVLLIALTPLVAAAWVAGVQFIELANSLPQYSANIQRKLEALQTPLGGWLERATDAVGRMGMQRAAMEPVPTPTGEAPVPVLVIDPPASPLQMVRVIVGPLTRPAAMLGILVVFVIFMLIQREDLRDRMIRLISQGQMTVTTQALAEVGSRIARYLRTQLLLNVGFGIIATLGLLLIGVPNALLWGFLSVGLRFIPYGGPLLSAGMPIVVSFAVSDSWTMPLLTAAMFITLEAISGNFFEPWLYGTTTGISSVALLVAAVFWAWLWGVPGLLLSTPMTVCLAVAGRYVPQLAFFNILLGAEPVMSPEVRLYQRLLAMDYDEASDIVKEYLKAPHSLAELYDEILIPTLRCADEDAEHGKLDERRQQYIYVSMRDLIDEAAQQSGSAYQGKIRPAPSAAEPPAPASESPAGDNKDETETSSTAPAPPLPLQVLTIPARDEADVLAGHMLGYLLVAAGIGAQNLTLEDLGTDLAVIIAESHPDLVCISSVPPFASTQARLRQRQVRLKAPGARVIIGLWAVQGDPLRARERLTAAGAEAVAFKLAEAVGVVQSRLRAQTPLTLAPSTGDPAAREPAESDRTRPPREAV